MKGCEQIVKCIINGCIAMSKPSDVSLTKTEHDQNGKQQNDGFKKEVTKVDKLVEPIKITKIQLTSNGKPPASGATISNGETRSVLYENDFSYIDDDTTDGVEHYNTVRKRFNGTETVPQKATIATTSVTNKRNDPKNSDKISQNPCENRRDKNKSSAPETMQTSLSDNNSNNSNINSNNSSNSKQLELCRNRSIANSNIDVHHSKIDQHGDRGRGVKCEDLTHNRRDSSVKRRVNNDKGSTDCSGLSENAPPVPAKLRSSSSSSSTTKSRRDQDQCRQKITVRSVNSSNKTQTVEIINKCSNENSTKTEQPGLHTNDKCKTEDMPGGGVSSSMVDNSSKPSIVPSTAITSSSTTTSAVNSIVSINSANSNSLKNGGINKSSLKITNNSDCVNENSVKNDRDTKYQSDHRMLSVNCKNDNNNSKDRYKIDTSKVISSDHVKSYNQNSVSSEDQPEMASNKSVVLRNEDRVDFTKLQLNLTEDEDEDPYTELEIYLEKVKREINEVFEQRKVLNDRSPRSMATDSDGNKSKLHQATKQCLPSDISNNKKFSYSSDGNKSRDGKRSMSHVLTDGDHEELEDRQNNKQQQQQLKMATYRKNLANIKAQVQEAGDVNVWANTILKELDNLARSDKGRNAKVEKDHSSCSDNGGFIKSQTRKCIAMPEKHTTIPLYSFNLDHPLLETSNVAYNSKKPPIDYTRKPTLIAGINSSLISNSNSSNNNSNSNSNSNSNITTNGNSNSNKGHLLYNGRQPKDIVTVLKIEEDSEGDRESQVGSLSTGILPLPKKEISQSSTLMLNDGTKKGSTSTIWTSEESILRSVGAVDEDNKSTSSSACDEASGGALSSGKSRNSLNSSDNDNIESSGIGTATPPKDIDFWKNFHPITSNSNTIRSTMSSSNGYNISNTSISPISRQSSTGLSSSLPLHRFGHKNYSNNSSDEHDLLEVLSLCDATSCDDDLINNESDLFDGIDSKSVENDEAIVILRNRLRLEYEGIDYSHSTPSSRAKKARSHSIETSQFPISRNEFDSYDKANDKDYKVFKARRPCCLPINQEPFQNNTSNMRELPSPSSASLHSGHGNLVLQELTTKSNSAPILLKKEKRRDDFCTHQNSLRYSRSQSDRYLAEIEAVEACKWLRAAGFPQYAQMYEDLQFPIDLNNVAKDHPMLENDPLQSLYRRLCILNRCATMRLDSTHKQHGQQKDDSDDEGFTLSENWTFQPQSRRWSRVGEMGLELQSKQSVQPEDCSSKDSSPDRFEDDMVTTARLELATHALSSSETQNDTEPIAIRFRRTGSERLKDGAKAFLRRVESIKSRRRKRQNREGLVISGPHVLDLSQMNQRVNDLKCVDVTTYSNPPSPTSSSPMHFPIRQPFTASNELKVPTDLSNDRFLSPHRLSPKHGPVTPRPAQSTRSSPLHFFHSTMPHLKEGKSDDSSSYYSDSQESSSGGGRFVLLRRHASRSRRFLRGSGKVDDIGALSDSECHQSANNKIIYKDANSNNTEVKVSKLNRGGSLNLGKDSKRYRDSLQTRSFRCRPARKGQKNSESDKEEVIAGKSPIVRWHSFQNHERPQLIFKKCFPNKSDQSTVIDLDDGTTFASMSSGQLQVIRKLALVTLTGYMERYCPTHRSGWNWELPKFIKKIKTPDYKDKKVFGVPLLLVVQRTGNSLPKSIREAIKWLEVNAMDQIGLFRKSGVKSRITKLKEVIETTSDDDFIHIFDTQQAYDVADMLKQYFRDLPESLLTTKMSETFVAIFQHLPPEVRADAVQSAVLLLPDEHREVLFSLLEFLSHVANHAKFNQMTANNLSVCLAPSLFNSSIVTGRSNSVSPRRRKGAGVPDAKELSETRASHECLAFMISNYEQLFTATREKISRCKFSYMEESKPVPLEALGKEMQFQNWKGYLYECTSSTIKEGREKPRGWINITSMDTNIEISYKKVGDGHPLRLWRFLTEIDGAPNEILHFILRERQCWDPTLLSSRIVEKLDDRSEIFQYACDGTSITDYCVLRSWQRDLPRGACVIVETSIDHQGAPLLLGGVRGVVLVSRYLIEPLGNGRSRVMHLARVDTKGRTPEWYNKSYGHICSHHLTKIRTSFQNGIIISSAHKP